MASTGPIGIQLPIEQILSALPRLAASTTPYVNDFASSIMTTDTRQKVAALPLDGGSIVGVAKGGAMVAPNMATMLAFLVTDLDLDHDALSSALRGAVDKTFNRLTIDGCESTNDSVFLFSTGGCAPGETGVFTKTLTEVCALLADQMARDAEGGTKLVRIRVSGASSEDEAAAAGKAIAASSLWRAAVHGGDANWGRVVAALGATARSMNLADLTVTIGDHVVFHRGEPVAAPGAAAAAMTGDEIIVGCRVGAGEGDAEVVTVDLSPQYVTLNAFGTT